MHDRVVMSLGVHQQRVVVISESRISRSDGICYLAVGWLRPIWLRRKWLWPGPPGVDISWNLEFVKESGRNINFRKIFFMLWPRIAVTQLFLMAGRLGVTWCLLELGVRYAISLEKTRRYT